MKLEESLIAGLFVVVHDNNLLCYINQAAMDVCWLKLLSCSEK
jgi:hypothetical protein